MFNFKKVFKKNITYNVHSLLHIVDCVREFGPCDNFSAYKYESSIMKLQKYIGSNTKVDDKKNSCFRIDQDRYGIVCKITGHQCIIRVYKTLNNFCTLPLPSRGLGIVLVDDKDLGEEEAVLLSSLETKCYRLPFEDKHVFIPLL